MKKIKVFVLVLFATQYCFAQQPCTDDALMNKKGNWKRVADANMKTGNQVQVINRIDKMQKLLLAAYPELNGVEAKWGRSMVNDPLVANGPNPFQLYALFLTYYCNTSKQNIELNVETGTWFYVYANHFNWFMDYDHTFTVHTEPVYLLTKKVGEIHGYPVYEGTSNSAFNYSRAVIITRPGNSPYVPVTRKEYLQLFVKLREKQRADEIQLIQKRPERSAAEQETAKQKALDNALVGASANRIEERKVNFFKRYRTDKEQKEEDLVNLNKRYDDYIKSAQPLLNNINEANAGLPAIVTGNYTTRFERFLSEEEGGRMLVRLNPDYFDSKLPNYIPQFLIVYWRWEKNKPSQNFKEQLEKNFDFDALKEMIDK